MLTLYIINSIECSARWSKKHVSHRYSVLCMISIRVIDFNDLVVRTTSLIGVYPPLVFSHEWVRINLQRDEVEDEF